MLGSSCGVTIRGILCGRHLWCSFFGNSQRTQLNYTDLKATLGIYMHRKGRAKWFCARNGGFSYPGAMWTFASDITPEMLERSRRPDPTRRLLGDPRPSALLMRAAPAIPRSARRASAEWFARAEFTSLVPASGKAPIGKRGPKSGKRENTAAAIRKALADKTLTVTALRAMPEKALADRCGVSRDTARQARNDVLLSVVENSTSTNDK